VFASRVAHECAHVFDLGDEYGDGMGTPLRPSPTFQLPPNLEARGEISTTTHHAPTNTTTTAYDKTHRLKWLWPRLGKAGLLADPPGRSLSGFHVPLRKGHGRVFRVGDVVRFREWPVRERPSRDPFVSFHRAAGAVFRVKAADDDGVGMDLEDPSGQVVDVGSPNPSNPDPRSWTDILLGLFNPSAKYALICPRVVEDVELPLVATPILQHIASSNGPLNAPGDQPCRAAASWDSTMTPTALPELSRLPRTRADIVGVYEGGYHHDCGVLRPAGRCKMRTSDQKVVPFCHVCRYLLVERVDPTRHGALDAIYEKVYPRT
jgi:hypothetical protein